LLDNSKRLFGDKELGANGGADSESMSPEGGVGVGESFSFTGSAGSGAGKSATDEVEFLVFGVVVSDVGMNGDIGEVRSQDELGVAVAFHKLGGLNFSELLGGLGESANPCV